MESEDGGTSVEAPIESHRHPPARRVAARHVTFPERRHSRLSEASHQLAVVLEGVDLDAEPELAEAVTDAVAAVDRASTVAERRDAERTRPTRRTTGNARAERASGTRDTGGFEWNGRDEPDEVEPLTQA